MGHPTTDVAQCRQSSCLLHHSSADWQQLIDQRLQDLDQMSRAIQQRPTVVIAEPNPIDFIAGFLAACTAECPVFLGNPNWTVPEWQQVLQLAQPDIIWGSRPVLPLSNRRESVHYPRPGWVMIPTGGSSGQIRFTIHTWETLSASVYGVQAYMQRDRLNSCCVLPLYHVSGLMQVMRSLLSGGQLVLHSFKNLEAGMLPTIDPSTFWLSLVPTQLKRLLQSPELVQWLSRLDTIFLGGAPAWPDLLNQAQQQALPLALTYGMTETASQVVALRPSDFLQGHRSNGLALPHAQVTVGDRPDQPLPPNQVGTIHIQSDSLFRGYYPHISTVPSWFTTDDVGYLDDQGYLYVVGRSSQKIITGGENVYPTEVEAAIRATGLVADVCVVGVPDADWGEAVTAVYVASANVQDADLKAAIAPHLSRFKHPKYWIAQPALPRNAQGKINLSQLKDLMNDILC